MSVHGHQMEREYSAQSLLSRGRSESESHPAMETGVYMSSFAATVFIGGLVTVGLSLMALLIALTVMLQTCQDASGGVVEMPKEPAEDYEFCRILALHVELNNLEASSLPSLFKELAFHSIQDGHYMRELNDTFRVVENYFICIRPGADGRDVVLMDADDFFPPKYLSNDDLLLRLDQNTGSHFRKDASHLKQMVVHQLFIKLRDSWWPLILLSRKHERQQDGAAEYLASVGCGGWSSLIMREDDEMQMDTREYFSKRKKMIQNRGCRIIGTISSQFDVFTGSSMREGLNFKLPNMQVYIE